ncbi:MAG: hypothetical protein AB8D78_08305 [Akkermansiaceae bacterium]
MKSSPNFSKLILGCGSLLAISSAQAVDLFWDGTPGAPDGTSNGGSGTWSTSASNWDTGAAYQAWNNSNNDTAIFGGTPGLPFVVTLGSNINLSGIEIDYGSNGNSGSYTFEGNGNTITLGNSGGKRGSNSPGPNIYLANRDTTVNLNANINNDGNLFTLAGERTSNQRVFVNGVISGSGGLSTFQSINATLSGANTYTGKTTIDADTTSGSTLNVFSINSVSGGTASSSLGAPTTIANGTIRLGNTGKQAGAALNYLGSGETTDRVLEFARNGNGATKTINNNGSGLLKFTSTAIAVGGSTNNDITLGGSGDGELVGGLNFAFRNLTKTGSGTWTLGGGIGATGNINVNGGQLNISGANVTTTVNVGNNSTLGGTGTVGGNVSINNGGTLSPGNSSGTLTFTGNLTINNGATYEFEGGFPVDGYISSQSDLVEVGGTLTLNDDWTLELGSGFEDGGSVLLFTYGALAPGADLDPTIDTSGLGFTPSGSLTLFDDGNGSIFLLGISAIPEPSTALLGMLGALVLLRRRR